MPEKITAEEIYTLIDTKQINKELGINLIENYGFRKQREYMEKIIIESSEISNDMKIWFDRINSKIDELFNSIMRTKN